MKNLNQPIQAEGLAVLHLSTRIRELFTNIVLELREVFVATRTIFLKLSSNRNLSILFIAILVLQRCIFLTHASWPLENPDTVTYFQFQVWGNLRLYTIPIVYGLIKNHTILILMQTSFTIFALAFSLIELLWRLAAHRVFFRLLVFALWTSFSTSTPTFIWDLSLLSESVSISLTLICLAQIFRFIRKPNSRNAYMLMAIYAVWLGAKSAHVLTGWLGIFLIALLVIKYNRDLPIKKVRRVLVLLTLFYVLLIFQIIAPNSTSTWNVVAMVHYVIERNSNWMNWLYDNGWPQNYLVFDDKGQPLINETISATNHSSFFSGPSIELYRSFLFAHPMFVLLGAYLLPVVGGSSFNWSDTVTPAFLYGSRWSQNANLDASWNLLNSWWSDKFGIDVIPVFLLFTISLSVLVTFIQVKKNIQNKVTAVPTSFFAPLAVIFFFIFRGGAEWLAAPTDPTRIWAEHSIAIRFAFLYLVTNLPCFSFDSRRKKKQHADF